MPDRGRLRREIEQGSPFKCIQEEVYLTLLRISEAIKRPVEQLLEQHGLSHAHYNVLRILRGAQRNNQGPLSCQVIGRRLISHHPDVTRLVDKLQTRSLVERSRGSDRRTVLVTITAGGMELLTTLDQPVLAGVQQVMTGLDASGHERLLDLLETLWPKPEAEKPPAP